MAVNPKIEFVVIDKLLLDPRNPRLGRAEVAKGLNQSLIENILKTWSLFELARSMARHGFWPQEALLIVEESVDGKPSLVVVEGNRRLAAAKLLIAARDDVAASASWVALATGADPASLQSLNELPCIRAQSRTDVDAFLGFRHVTGIKEWRPAEKAEFISYLVRERGMTYTEVAESIGSKAKVVHRNYVTYQILEQLESEGFQEEVDVLETRFSVLFLALRNRYVREFVGLDDDLSPTDGVSPVSQERIDDLLDLIGWMFGTNRRPKVLKESRDVERFAFVLSSGKAVEYLRGGARPQLDAAYRLAGGEGANVVNLLDMAAYNVEQALSVLQHHANELEVIEAASRLARDVRQVAVTIPRIQALLCSGEN